MDKCNTKDSMSDNGHSEIGFHSAIIVDNIFDVFSLCLIHLIVY